MKFLIDFFPVILFLIAYKFTNIYTATLVIIIASMVQVAAYWLVTRRFEKMHLVSLALFIVLGGLTLYLRDKRFIMWKPTIVNWLFAGGFALSPLFMGGKPLIQSMLSGQINLPNIAWKKLNWAWIVFFIVSGLINLYFAQRYIVAQNALTQAAPAITSEQLADLDCETGFTDEAVPLCETARQKEKTWVSVKVFGLMGLTVLFIIGQTIFLMRYMEQDDPDPDNPSTDRESSSNSADSQT